MDIVEFKKRVDELVNEYMGKESDGLERRILLNKVAGLAIDYARDFVTDILKDFERKNRGRS